MLRRISFVLVGWLLLSAQPCVASVVMTFWSHDQDDNFPHAFFALDGTPDAGGESIDANYGFTAKAVTPAILFGSVGGKVEASTHAYMRRSDARFSVVLNDVQFAAIQSLIAEWSAKSSYNLNNRNCVHFVAEAARRVDLILPHLPKLMKKPKSFLIAVGVANPDRVVQLNMSGRTYFATYRGSGIIVPPVSPAPKAPISLAAEYAADADKRR